MTSSRPALAVRVEDSDWCLVLGRFPDDRLWSWVYGEAAALGFDAAHPWLPSVDPDELEDSLAERAAQCADEVLAWAGSIGLGELDRGAVERVLMTHDVFAETGWWMMRSLFGLDEVEVELVEVEEPHVLPVMPADRGAPPPVRAIALDHASQGWAHLNAGDLMGRFGEPPCLLEWGRVLYLATDPPVTLFTCADSLLAGLTGATGAWSSVPVQHAGTLTDAAAWARTHVGAPGAAMPEDRPPLLFELIGVEDGVTSRQAAPPEWRDSQLHQIAPPVTARVVVGWTADADPGTVAAALARVHEALVVAVADVFVAQGRGVHYGEQTEPGAFDLHISGATQHASGRFGVTTGSPAAWTRLLAKVRDGDLADVDLRATRTNAFGSNWPDHATASLGFQLSLASPEEAPDRTELDEEPWPDEPTPPGLRIEVDAEFAAVVPVSSLLELLDQLVELLPVQHASLQVSRFRQEATPWLIAQPATQPYDDTAYPVAEVLGELRWLRASVEPPEFVARVN